ncbi:MAG: diguanylate cyclase (GGDEF)-like protein/PAS domain S-box-containing protein [bacterium]|jgi:diguanylate cyclase (GGDEF)-like protein/PAS domain S-box-containing protein
MKSISLKDQAELIQELASTIGSSTYFKSVDNDLLTHIFASSVCIDVEKGDAIIQQGAENDFMVYILVEGDFEVLHEGNFILRIHRTGQLIGEIAVISSDPRSADVIATKKSRVVAIQSSFLHDKDEESLILGNSFLTMFCRVLAEKVRTTTERAKLYEDSVLEVKEIEEYSLELKRDIQQQLEQIKLYSQVVENNQNGILVCNLDGAVQFANHSFSELFEYKKEDLDQLAVTSLFEALTTQSLKDSFSQGWKGERSAIKKDRTTFPAFVMISPITQKNSDEITAFAVDVRDITTEKDYENNILEKNRELQQTYQELESTVNDLEKSNQIKNDFLANMSTQLKTPLVSITNHTEKLEKQIFKQGAVCKDAAHILARITEEKNKLEKMVGNLLTMAELNVGLSSLDLNTFRFEEIFEVLSVDYPLQLSSLKLVVEEQRSTIVADKNKLCKAIGEILDYALKSVTTNEQSLSITYRSNRKKKALEIIFNCGDLKNLENQDNSDWQTLSNGIELNIQKIELAIPLAKRIFELHKGEIQIIGSDKTERIIARLPLDIEKGVNQGIKIVIIDEDEYERMIFRGITEQLFENAEIFEFDNQLSSLNAVNALAPDLIIVDPKFSNPDWDYNIYLQKMKSDTQENIPILVISELLNDYDFRNTILDIGVSDFLQKPYTTIDIQFKVNSIINMRQKVSQLSSSMQKAEKSAVTDGLTNLFNRKYYDNFISDQLHRAHSHDSKCSIIMTDIDNFKNYNDTNGHQLGDDVLKTFAQILKGSVRESDMVARYGGEEFIIVLPNTAKKMALLIAEKLRANIESNDFPNGINQPLGRVTSSFGVSTYPENGLTPEILLKGSDHCLYIAKERGRNTVVGAEGIVTIEHQ